MIKRLLRKDVLGAAIILVWLAVYYGLSLKFSVKAAVFPQIAILATAFLSVVYIISVLFKPVITKIAPSRLFLDKQRHIYIKVTIIFSEILAYVLAIELIGFYLSSIMFTIACMLTVRKGKISIIGYIGAILIVTVIYLVFKYFFTVDFTAGEFTILDF